MKKFTDIKQFKDVIRTVRSSHDYQGKDVNGDAIYEHKSPYPTIKFQGTVKCHGTNAAIVKYKDSPEIIYQSRENELSLIKDNAGFAASMMTKKLDNLFDNIEYEKYCVIYGEWVGQKIQKGVAISELSKRFILFAVKIDDVYQDFRNYKYLKSEEQGIYNILDFPTFEIEIDFNCPELSQNKIIEMTLSVENECPVGKHFGVLGIGEGIVFASIDAPERYIFKSKGVKHQNSKVITLKEVDSDRISKLKYIAEQLTPIWRLDQMVQLSCDTINGGEILKSKIPTFMQMLFEDIIKEESDIIAESGFDISELKGEIGKIGRNYFIQESNKI